MPVPRPAGQHIKFDDLFHTQRSVSVDCQSKPQSSLPFCDPSLSFMERAEDLVSRLTTEETIAQTTDLDLGHDDVYQNYLQDALNHGDQP